MAYRIDGVIYHSDDEARGYIASGSWLNATAGEKLAEAARLVPDRAAVITPEGAITYRELDSKANVLAHALLALGLVPMDRAIFQMGSVLETVIALFGCFRAGIVPVCTLPQHREVEVGFLSAHTGARAHFVQADFGAFDLVEFAREMAAKQPEMRHVIVARGPAPDGCVSFEALLDGAPSGTVLPALTPDDVLIFQLSGGSTGIPKVIPRHHGEYLGYSAAWNNRFHLGHEDVQLWALPLIHNAAMLVCLFPALIDARSWVLLPKFDIDSFLDAIACHRVTMTGSIGPISARILEYAAIREADPSSLKLFITLNRADLIEAHIGVTTSNFFGMTEGLLMGSPPDAPAQARFTTVGFKVCPEDEVRIFEIGGLSEVPVGQVGELAYRGPSSLRGYFKADEATKATLTADGFVRTGDLAKAHLIAGQVYLSFEGRLKDNIDRGGEKFGAEEVELMVARHPAVAEVAVVAMPDRVYGEKACAYVIRRPGQELPDVKELGAFLVRQGIAKFKCPERIEEVAAFPVTRVGKTDKGALRTMIADKMKAEGSAS